MTAERQTFHIDAGAAGFMRALPAWKKLAGQSRYFFQTPDWLELAAPRMSDDVAWITLDGDGRVAATMALARSTRTIGGVPLRILKRATVGEAGLRYNEGLLDPSSLGPLKLRELLDAAGPWDMLRLSFLREGSPWLAIAEAEVSIREADHGVGVIDTRMPFDECWNGVPKNMRNAIRKARRRITERGGGDISVHVGGRGVDPAFDRFIALEGAGWKGRRGGGWANTPVEGGLWRNYLRRCDRAAITFLTIGGTLAAGQVTVRHARTMFLPRIAYNEDLSELSPSNVLMADLIRQCCDDPAIDRIDCMMWQPWHQRWAMRREPTHRVTMFNRRTARGLALEAASSVNDALHNIGDRLRTARSR